MLIEDYEIELYEPECVPGARGVIYSAKAHLKEDISQVMPYLNAVLDRPEYSGDYQYILWKEPERSFALRPHELAVSSVLDRRHATELTAKVVAMINDVWEKKEQITPDHERKTRPRTLDIFKVLPGTNCGDCGLASCMAFAVGFAEGSKCPDDCPTLLEPGKEDALKRLKELGI